MTRSLCFASALTTAILLVSGAGIYSAPPSHVEPDLGSLFDITKGASS